MKVEPERHEKVISFAFDINGKEIYISNAKRGESNYFCTGCGRRLVAHKGQVKIHHFKHYAPPGQGEKKCTYSDETHRHKLAKNILMLNKEIKVPSVFKSSPNEGNPPRLVSKSHIIRASSVTVEKAFCLNENFELVKGMLGDYVVPDVTFLDKAGRPILFIEIHVKNKVSKTKMLKYRRLMVDVVEVSIPKGDAIEIEQSFKTTKRTKWIYNNEEEKAIYLHLPSNDRGEISETYPTGSGFDGEMDYRCWQSEIKEVVRSIETCLQSKQHLEARTNLRNEIERIEQVETRERRAFESEIDRLEQSVEKSRTPLYQKLERIRGIKRRASTALSAIKYGNENPRINCERRIREELSELDRPAYEKHRDLEERYLAKKREIEDSIKQEQERLRTYECRKEKQQDAEREAARIERTTKAINREIGGIESEIKGVEGEIEDVERKYRESSLAIGSRNASYFAKNDSFSRCRNLLTELEEVERNEKQLQDAIREAIRNGKKR